MSAFWLLPTSLGHATRLRTSPLLSSRYSTVVRASTRRFLSGISQDGGEGNSNPANGATTHFGYRTVGVDEKAKLVGEVFSKVAERYDLMNDAMSAGMHRLWKDQLVNTMGPMRGTTIVDLAGGTGDVTSRILERLKTQAPHAHGKIDTRVIVCDINAEMLGEGKRRASVNAMAAEGVSLEWVRGDAETLPFADRSVDALTIAFGLRNVTRTMAAIEDVHRVLKRGGRFLCMEFSHLPEGPIKSAYDAYSFAAIPAMGKALAGDAEPYQYLVESIRKFPKQDQLAAMMREAGFRHVTYDNILMGVVAIHSGFKE